MELTIQQQLDHIAVRKIKKLITTLTAEKNQLSMIISELNKSIEEK